MNQMSRKMIEQILTMRRAGHSKSAIALALGITRNTVRRYLRMQLASQCPTPKRIGEWALGLDWDLLCRDYAAGVTIKQLYGEHEIAASYSQFSRQLHVRMPAKAPDAAPSLRHEPGERTQVDYADGISIIDRRTGMARKTQLFCGVLPFSSKTFAEFSWDQKLASFIRSHENMWHYFGGITPYVVLDNLKAGVSKAHRYDPEINPTYCDYANHTGFGVLPARPATPRDKAAVEAAIGAIQRDFYQQVRNEIFYELDELNIKLRSFLELLNSRVMAEHGASRNDRFMNEKDLLRSFPESPYVFSEWTEATVHPDCCIQVQKGYYSVPYQHIGQRVRVKMTNNLMTIFSLEMAEIAVHARVGMYKKSLVDAHFPNRLMQSGSFEIQRIRENAQRIGPETSAYVDWQFDISRPLTALRRMQGMIRLCRVGVGDAALEFAAAQARQFMKRDLRYFEQCAINFQKRGGGGPRSTSAPKRIPETLNLHQTEKGT